MAENLKAENYVKTLEAENTSEPETPSEAKNVLVIEKEEASEAENTSVAEKNTSEAQNTSLAQNNSETENTSVAENTSLGQNNSKAENTSGAENTAEAENTSEPENVSENENTSKGKKSPDVEKNLEPENPSEYEIPSDAEKPLVTQMSLEPEKYSDAKTLPETSDAKYSTEAEKLLEEEAETVLGAEKSLNDVNPLDTEISSDSEMSSQVQPIFEKEKSVEKLQEIFENPKKEVEISSAVTFQEPLETITKTQMVAESSDLKAPSDNNGTEKSIINDIIVQNGIEMNAKIDTVKSEKVYPDDLNPFDMDDNDEILPPEEKSESINNPGVQTRTPQVLTRKVNLVMTQEINGKVITQNEGSQTSKSTENLQVKGT